MDSSPESRTDSVLAEFAADTCRRLAAGLLDRTGEELRTFIAHEMEGLNEVLENPELLSGAEAPSDPPWVNRRGHTVINTNPVTSRRNALAPLVTEKSDGDGAVMTVAPLSRQYQGPRDRVHGGYIGVLLDHVLWRAVHDALKQLSFTRTLTITYERAAPIGEELTIRGWVTKVDGRKTYAEGELTAGGVVCARAEGLWVSPRPEG